MVGVGRAGGSRVEQAESPFLELAAAYVAAVRSAPTAPGRVRAVAAKDGVVAVSTLLRSLPLLPVAFSERPAGRELRTWFGPRRTLPLDRAPVAALTLPSSPAEYLRGRTRQALRTNIKRAGDAGLTCGVLDSPAELRRAVEHIALRRGTTADGLVPQRPGLPRQFLVAHDGAGDPIGLCETVVDGRVAGLAALITTLDHEQSRLARYLLHARAVEGLIGQQVDTLVVGGSMLLTSEGTRYFQRRTGFVPVWLRLLPPADGPRRLRPAPNRRPVQVIGAPEVDSVPIVA